MSYYKMAVADYSGSYAITLARIKTYYQEKRHRHLRKYGKLF